MTKAGRHRRRMVRRVTAFFRSIQAMPEYQLAVQKAWTHRLLWGGFPDMEALTRECLADRLKPWP